MCAKYSQDKKTERKVKVKPQNPSYTDTDTQYKKTRKHETHGRMSKEDEIYHMHTEENQTNK